MRRGHLLALIAALAVLLAGCGTATGDAQKSILDKVQETKILKVATVDANPPWSSLGPDGQPAGYDIEIAKAIAETLGAQIEWTITDSPGRVTSAQTGAVDLVVANFTATPTRALAVGFSTPYFISQGQLMVAANSPHSTFEDLNAANAKVAIPRGGAAEQLVPQVCPNCEVLSFTTATDAISAVDAGQADAAANDSLVNAAAMAKFPGKYKAIEGTFGTQNIALGIPPGDFKWTEFLNVWVRTFNQSGANAALFKESFGFDPPSIPGG